MKYTYLFAAMLLFTGLHAQEKFTVYFDTDKDMPNIESTEKLEKWIAENKDADVSKLYAYADSVGKPEYNFELSKRRLIMVNDLIAKGGIVYKQVTARAFGEEESASGALQDNRRVDIFYTKPQPMPQPVKELEKAVSVAKKGEKLKLEGLNFYNNSDKVLPESEHVLQELLDIMLKNKKLEIEIQGHICCYIDEVENVSVRRAKAVYDFLIANGVNMMRLNMKGFAGTKPIHPIPERNEKQRRENRRVEIEIIEN